MARNARHPLLRPMRTHGIGAGSDDDFVYKTYRVRRQIFTGQWWIEKDGYVITRDAKSAENAKRIIDEDLAG